MRHLESILLTTVLTACMVGSATWAGPAQPADCPVYFEDMESGAPGWTSSVRSNPTAKVADPPGPDTWHLADTTCTGGELGDTMYLSNGNAGTACGADTSRDLSQLLSPPIRLPSATQVVLEFDALSFDEAGSCRSSASFDKKDVGITLDGGATYTLLNDCTALTDGSGARSHLAFDITSWSGQDVQIIFVYDTVDETRGDTFAIDNVSVTTGDCRDAVCGDGIVDEGETCDPPGQPTGEADECRATCSFCGDGVVDADAGEQCDDGNNLDGDACSPHCRLDGSGCVVFEDDMESGGERWLGTVRDASKVSDPPGPQTWHADRFTCRNDDLGSTWMVANGNDGETCTPSSARERSQLIGPRIALPRADLVTLEFDALSFDEAGTCSTSAFFDRHDVGITLDGGATYDILNDCFALADGSGTPLRHRLDISAYAGRVVQVVFFYDTVDDTAGHTFAVDNVKIAADDCSAGPINIGLAEFNHRWTGVAVPHRVENPVVIVGPASRNGADPGVVRVRYVGPDSFAVRFDEWEYLDSAHLTESASFLHLPAGRRTLPDGSVWEVGTFTLGSPGKVEPVLFAESFQAAPFLFLTIQTANDPVPAIVRALDVTPDGFSAALFEEEGLGKDHNEEIVGYLAIETPDNFGEVGIDGVPLPFLLQRLSLNNSLTPMLGWNLRLAEEASADPEMRHPDETVDALAIGAHLFSQAVSMVDDDPLTIRRLDPGPAEQIEWGIVRGVTHRWKRVPLFRNYADPIVVVRPASFTGTDPGVIRLHDVARDAFSVRYQEWSYLNVAHNDEDLFYIVAESGEHGVGKLGVHAGRFDRAGSADGEGWNRVYFDTPFAAPPAVFAAVETFNDSDPVTTRVRERASTGFDLTLQEEEASDSAHGTETVGWIAVEVGAGSTSNGRRLDVFSALASDAPEQIALPRQYNRRFPITLVDVNSAESFDPCMPRILDLNRRSFSLFLQEESSSDEETTHPDEEIVIFAAD